MNKSTSVSIPRVEILTFEKFFSQSWPLACRLASLLTQDSSAGEEIAQEVMSTIYRKWDSVEQPDAYMRTSLVNASNNWHRNNKRRMSKLPLLVTSDQVDFVVTELTDAIAKLPFRQRTVIVLRYYADLSELEIAIALGCRPGTVKSLCSRALKTLAREVER